MKNGKKKRVNVSKGKGERKGINKKKDWGVCIGEYYPAGGGISANVIWGKNLKRWKRKKRKMGRKKEKMQNKGEI